MKKLFPIVLVTFFALAHPCSPAADVIDRIVATVNGRAILQSDWEDAICYEAFMDGRPLNKLTIEERQATLDRLIDQELLREQLHPGASAQTSRKQLEQRIQEVRKLYPGTESEEGWVTTLERHGIDEKELERRIAQQFEVMRLVEARLRPGIQIDSRSVEIYYQETLIPQLRKSGGRQLALSEVAPKIRELLTQQKINDLLSTWLRNLRAEGRIQNQQAQAATSAGANSR